MTDTDSSAQRRAQGNPKHLVVKEAINWMLRLRNNATNPRLQQQCASWRAAHQEHELAWLRVQSLQQELTTNLRAIPGAGVAFDTLENSAQGLGRRQALKVLSGVLVMGGAAWIGKDQLAWQRWTADYATVTGERRSFQLPDGTRLQLNTDSAADLHFNARQRLISLTRGEIGVTCTPDGNTAALQVHTRHALFEGREARFVVRDEGQCTRLSVIAGRVAIVAPQAPGGAVTHVNSGESYQVFNQQIVPAPPANMDIGAWADGLIVTRDMRLGDFLAEVSRYRSGYLACAPGIADLRLSGVFRLEDTDKLLAVLPHTLPVQLRYRTRWWVRLEPLV